MLSSDVWLRPVSDRHAPRGAPSIAADVAPEPALSGCAPRSVGQHRTHVSLGRGYAVHLGVTMKPPHGLAPPDAAHVIFNGIAGHHWLAKLALVDGEKVNRARLLRAFHRLDAYHASGLRHGLDHHHARIYRTLRKMPEKRRFVDGDVLDADPAVIASDIDDPVDQQHRIAVRERLQDLVDVHELEADRCLLHHSCPSPFGSAVPPRARRSSATSSR